MTNRLKDLRLQAELTQSELSIATGVDQKSISNYETGKTCPDGQVLSIFADFFKVSVDYILGRTDLPNYTNKEINKRITNAIKMLSEIQDSIPKKIE